MTFINAGSYVTNLLIGNYSGNGVVLSFPDPGSLADSIVYQLASQTLSNKTITSSTLKSSTLTSLTLTSSTIISSTISGTPTIFAATMTFINAGNYVTNLLIGNYGGNGVVLSFPDPGSLADSIVYQLASQTLSNKTINSSTFNSSTFNSSTFNSITLNSPTVSGTITPSGIVSLGTFGSPFNQTYSNQIILSSSVNQLVFQPTSTLGLNEILINCLYPGLIFNKINFNKILTSW